MQKERNKRMSHKVKLRFIFFENTCTWAFPQDEGFTYGPIAQKKVLRFAKR